ncbi:MAG: DUF3592 domain-containing protein [Verrucomicrobiota bacterium]
MGWQVSKGKAQGNRQLSSGCLALFGLPFLAAGLFFAYVSGQSLVTALVSQTWEEVPCVVDEFRILVDRKADEPFHPKVRYHFQWEGERREGRVLRHESDSREDEYEALAELRWRFLGEGDQVCRVNPANPSENALLAGSAGGGLLGLIFGLVFAVVGGGMLVGGVVGWRRRKAAVSSEEALSSTEPARGAPWVLVVVASLSGLAGLGMLVGLALPMVATYLDARSWEEVPATVIWSRVKSHEGEDNTTYSVDIFYRYQFQGQTHRSNSVSLAKGSSSGRASKQRKVRQFPRGKEIVCYVDPEKPWKALLEREFAGWSWVTVLFPLPFLAFGVGGWLWFGKKRAAEQREASLAKEGGSEEELPAVKTLAPSKKRLLWVAGAWGAAIFWNGILSVFLSEVWQAWKSGSPDWFLTLFLVPFVLVGLGLILHACYRLGAAVNPSPVLSLRPGGLILGEETEWRWRVSSGVARLRSLRVYLVGEEEARFQRGEDTVLDKQIFFEEKLVDAQTEAARREGRGILSLPLTSPPSFRAENNQIRWRLRVRGAIRWWPDVHDEYEIAVRAAKLSQERL